MDAALENPSQWVPKVQGGKKPLNLSGKRTECLSTQQMQYLLYYRLLRIHGAADLAAPFDFAPNLISDESEEATNHVK